jgi:exodeoxyribonuclease VII small subunit
MTSRKKTDTLSFEQAMQELEGIVANMEQGELPLEDALQQFERGIVLARLSQQKLKNAEQKVQILMSQNGQASLIDFNNDTFNPE